MKYNTTVMKYLVIFHSTLQIMSTVRIGIVGPVNCGKSTIAEYYTEVTTEPTFEYRPTQGLRILETGRKIRGFD